MNGLVRLQPIDDLLKIQVVAWIVTTLIIFGWLGLNESIAYAYGGGIAIGNTLLQRRHLISSVKAKSSASMNLRKAYHCVAERWILTVVMFAVAFTVLMLAPLPLLAGFIAMQLILLFGNLNRA